jgi:hypothetical protein
MISELSTQAAAAAHGSAAKRVALRLRGMALVDQQWLLARLPQERRQAVDKASRELQRIVGEAVLDFGLFLESPGTPAARADHRVNQSGFAAVHWVLGRLPLQYLGVFLGSRLWLDAEQYLKQMSPKRRKAIETAPALSPTPRVTRAIADVIAELAGERQAQDHG